LDEESMDGKDLQKETGRKHAHKHVKHAFSYVYSGVSEAAAHCG